MDSDIGKSLLRGGSLVLESAPSLFQVQHWLNIFLLHFALWFTDVLIFVAFVSMLLLLLYSVIFNEFYLFIAKLPWARPLKGVGNAE